MESTDLSRLNDEVQALSTRLRHVDENLAAAQGRIAALDFLLQHAYMTHPKLEVAHAAIAKNTPKLLASLPGTHPAGAMMRSVLSSFNTTIEKVLAASLPR